MRKRVWGPLFNLQPPHLHSGISERSEITQLSPEHTIITPKSLMREVGSACQQHCTQHFLLQYSGKSKQTTNRKKKHNHQQYTLNIVASGLNNEASLKRKQLVAKKISSIGFKLGLKYIFKLCNILNGRQIFFTRFCFSHYSKAKIIGWRNLVKI